MTNKTIAVLLIALTGLLLFLFTCQGPATDSMTEAVSTTDATDVPEEPIRADASVRPEAPTSPERAEPVVDEPVAAPGAPRSASSPQNDPAAGPAQRPEIVAVPAADLPVAGVEALLAVHPRDLEGGSGVGMLLVPADSLRRQLRIPIDPSWLPADYTRGQPASTINTPTAYGQQLGDVFAGVGYQDRIRYDDWRDGIASFGLGLGDPTQYVGLDVAVNILDTYTEFADDWSLSVKLHRRLPYRSAIAVGHENIWHTDGTDGGSSRYVVVSKVLLFRDRPTAAFGSMVVNAGLGNDRFLPERQFARGEDGVNAFGSVGLRLLPPVNAVANWTGQDLALGLSIAPVRRWPLVITPAVVDVTGEAGDGARFTVSAGLNYSLRP